MTGVILGIVGIVGAGTLIIGRWDVPLPMNMGRYAYMLCASALEGIAVTLLTEGEPWHSRLLLSVIGGSLLLASVTDLLIRQVYNFIWWPAMCAALILLERQWSLCRLYGLREELLRERAAFLLVFLLLQFTVFERMYGRADVYAFCVCAAAGTARGMDGWGMFVHMLFAYGLLLFVQTFRRNIDKRGNLRRKVPFVPYIVVAFWATLLWGKW